MATKQAPVVTMVKMDDGREIGFTGDRRLNKEAVIDRATGTVAARLDFRSGETRLFTIPAALLLDFAAHGALQKYGDATSGITDLEKMVEAVDDVDETVQSGNWNAVRESTGAGMAGASILARALVEVTKQPIAAVRAHLATLTPKVKAAVRLDPSVAPVIKRLEAEKAERAAKRGVAVAASVDTKGILAGFAIVPQAPAATEGGVATEGEAVNTEGTAETEA